MESDDLVVSSGQYAEVLRRRFRVVVLGVVASALLAGIAFAFAGGGPSLAAATATVEVRPVTENRFGSNTRPKDLVSMPTELEVMQSTEVAQRVIDQLGLDEVEPRDLLRSLTVENPTDTLVLILTYTAGDQDVALVRTQAFAEEYLEFRQSTMTASIDRAVRQIETQSEAARVELAAAYEADRAASTPQARSEAQARVTAANIRLQDYEQQLAGLRGVDVDPGTVVSNARPVVTTSAPGWLTAAGVFGLGLVAALGAAVVVDRLDERPRERSEVASIAMTPVFGAVAAAAVATDDDGASTGARSARARRMLGEYRRLRLLLETPVDQRVRNLLVVTPIDDNAAGEVATNLARVVTRAREKALLVWCEDVRRTALDELGVTLENHLDDVLQGRLLLSEVIESVPSQPGLSVVDLAVGRTSAVSVERLRQLYRELTDMFDLVITVAPSASPADTAELAAFIDASVVAVDAQRASRESIATVVGLLGAVGCRPMATFVTRTRPWW